MPNNSPRQVNCPADDVLLAFRRKELKGDLYDAVSLHLLFCNDCIESLTSLPWEELESPEGPIEVGDFGIPIQLTPTLRRAIELFRDRRLQSAGFAPKTSQEMGEEGGLKIGQIWRTKTERIVVPKSEQPEYFSVTELSSRPHLVVITGAGPSISSTASDYHLIEVAPIDAETEHASEYDALVSDERSPFGYSFIIQLWNEQLMLQENLDVCLGALSADDQSMLLAALEQPERKATSNESYSLEAVVMNGSYQNALVRYRAKEYEDTQYLRVPAQSFLETLTEDEDTWSGFDEVDSELPEGMAFSLPLLSTFQSSELLAVGALGENSVKEESVKEIPLNNFFNESILDASLPWADPIVRIVKDVVSRKKGRVQYIAYIGVRSEANKYGTLRIVLRTRDGQQGEVRLHADYPSGIIKGDVLPADWGAIRPILYLEK